MSGDILDSLFADATDNCCPISNILLCCCFSDCKYGILRRFSLLQLIGRGLELIGHQPLGHWFSLRLDLPLPDSSLLHDHLTSSVSSSPLLSSITPLFFHSKLETFLFLKSYPP